MIVLSRSKNAAVLDTLSEDTERRTSPACRRCQVGRPQARCLSTDLPCRGCDAPSVGWLCGVDGNWPVIGVVGGRGGAGASTFACVLAAMSALGGRAVLVDLDAAAGGIDVLLGIEATSGARWSGLRLDGGRLDPDMLVAGLPQWGSVAVLSADVAPAPGAVGQVLDVAARAGAVVVELGRSA